MTWLINVDNGGMTTGFCLVDGVVRYNQDPTGGCGTPGPASRRGSSGGG
jgi:hypothetical protein